MSVERTRLQFRIADRLQDERAEGEALLQLLVTTPDGDVRTDVAWASPERRSKLKTTDGPLAPEICVEVVPSEAEGAAPDLRETLFDAGAQEVWICDPSGAVRFFGPEGERETSDFVPGFPSHVAS